MSLARIDLLGVEKIKDRNIMARVPNMTRKGASLAHNRANYEKRKAAAEANARAKALNAATKTKHPKANATRRRSRRGETRRRRL
jgi:hypothetical protein